MEFKENDRCEVFGTGTHGDGMTLTIIGKAPNKEFRLPNGVLHSAPNDDDSYVVKLDQEASAPVQVGRFEDGTPIMTNQFKVTFGVVAGRKMRLIAKENPND